MSSAGLLERDASVTALGRAVEQACAERGGTRLIVGPAGIGKTALLDRARALAAERGALVLGARASELDRGFGFGILHQLLEPVLHAAGDERRARLFAGAAHRAEALFGVAAPPEDPEYAILSGLYWLVANLADERPLVLCVDDLHWADVASLRMLEFLGRRIDDLPVLVVGTARLNEPDAPVALLSALQALAETIELAPLSRAAVGTMLADALHAVPEDGFRDAVRDATGGNPLLLSVLAREAAQHGLRGRAGDAGEVAEIAARGIVPAVVRRLASLGAEARQVARAAAILGERSRLDDLVALAGSPPDAVRAALGRLADAQIVEPGGWTYVHPLVRGAVEAAIPHAERDRLHRVAAGRLRERGARPAEIALHWLATAPAGDAAAVADLRDAARAAAAEGATSTAIDLLRRALDEGAVGADVAVGGDARGEGAVGAGVSAGGDARGAGAVGADVPAGGDARGADVSPPDHARLLLELAELELRTLRPEGPERMREALAAGLDGRHAVRAHAALGTVLLLSDPAAAFAEIDAALAQADDRGLRLRLEASALEALTFVDALDGPRRARYEEIRSSTAPSVVELAHLASEAALAGRPAHEVATLAGRATADGVLLADVGPGGSTWNLLTHALRFAEQPDAARRLLIAGDRVVRERGLRAAGAFVDQSWAYWHRDFGSVARGLAHAQAGYDAIRDAGVPMSVAAIGAIVAECLVLLDRVDEAEAVIEQPLDAVEGTFVEVFALSARGFTRAAAGRDDEAERDLRRVVAILDARGWHAPGAARGRLRLAELLAGQGRAEEALELMEHDVGAAHTQGARGCALYVRALARDDEATLRAAIAALAGSPLRLDHGRALLALGATLRRGGDPVAARAALREALDAASRTESAQLQRRVRAELEASGARPRRERVSGVEALTPSERRVAELAADGLTNREIAEVLWVTRKTVEYHLGHVYGKLGVRSRAVLPRALAPAETLG